MSRFAEVALASGQAPTFTYACPSDGILPGDLVRAPFGKRVELGLVLRLHDIPPPFPVRELVGRALDRPFVPGHLVDLVLWMSDYYLCPPGVAASPLWSAAGPSTLVRLGLGKRKARAIPGAWSGQSLVLPGERPDLEPSRQQELVARTITEAIREEVFRPFLLHGVTGSGKTVTYLLAARAAIEAGKQVLILVPEIGLTPQTVRRTADFLGRPVAVLHSQLTDAERARAWTALRDGEAMVALGPRSALFAPLFRPGLVIVDEEHDGSYKQSGDSPRYHGRDAAVWLARRIGVPVVLGSATPSLESWHNAKTGRYGWIELPVRATGAPMPTIRAVDLRMERKRTGGALSGVLREQLVETIRRGRSAVILHNRRGWSPQAVCLDCAAPVECPDCPGLSLTWHRDRSRLVCHHCGIESPPPRTCPACGSGELEPRGFAIQRVEDELRRLMPQTQVARMDRDIASRPGTVEAILDKFRAEGGVLLGTQMVAKGHDIPAVALVGVTDADIGSQTPDFRASERTFQILSQVAGRSGRSGEEPGEVLLQTRQPESTLLAQVMAHDFPAFASRELSTRKALLLPPFSRLILLDASSPEGPLAEGWLQSLADRLQERLDRANHSLAGPLEAPIPVVGGRHRFHLLAKAAGDAAGSLRRIVRECAQEFPPPPKVRAIVDVDPLDLL